MFRNLDKDIAVVISLVLAHCPVEGHYIEVFEAVRLYFYLGDTLLSDEFLVIPSLSEDAIIGAATMQKWRIKPLCGGPLDFEHDMAIVERTVAPSPKWPRCN